MRWLPIIAMGIDWSRPNGNAVNVIRVDVCNRFCRVVLLNEMLKCNLFDSKLHCMALKLLT